jgi:hypothetical protein
MSSSTLLPSYLHTLALSIGTNLFVLGVYISDLKERNIKDDFFAVLFGIPIPSHCVGVSEKEENVLELDLARAWREMGQKASWSNEVAVEVVIR